jgi:DNA-binding winged helix-turn-helix (wHTH) protein
MKAGQKEQPLIWRFGLFEVDSLTGELRKNGLKLKIQEQPLQILLTLAERQGEVVTREELREKLWPNASFGDFNHGLNNAVNRLREVLGDSAECPSYIETLPRRGYRLLPQVESIRVSRPELQGAPPTVKTVKEVQPRPAESRPQTLSGRRIGVWHIAGLSALAIGLLAISGVTMLRAPRSTARRIGSIAVLPLDNVSGDSSQEYFADGLTDALTTELAA